ncbi:MAG: phosphoenolpyruvate carboxylase [Bdellovibrionales bacterium]
MSTSVFEESFEVLNPRPEHFEGIQDLCRRVYPFSKPWSLDQLASHRSHFPDGQLIVVEIATGKIVGMAFSLIISWDDYSHQDNWQNFTSSGFFYNHDPKRGKTLYGAEVMSDPEYRGRGIGKALYRGREEIVYKYDLKRIRAGARLIGYSKYKDQLTPVKYVEEVVSGRIYDPTLSFQLSRGFKVIDVAKNYLHGDPDSLGHAAVIEWLNPHLATDEDRNKQDSSWQALVSGDRFVPEHLPKELRRLVRKTTLALGAVIKEQEGEKFYKRVEKYRQFLKKTRKPGIGSELRYLMSQIKRETAQDQLKIAHAFAAQLELVNVCEAAYRTWRLRQRTHPTTRMRKTKLTFVLTAHPTEARRPGILRILYKVGRSLTKGLQNNFVFDDEMLSTQLRLLWLQPLAKSEAPSVLDETDYILSMVFAPDTLNFILSDRPGYEIRLRTWVGGDRDGHPGVDASVMLQSLTRSRQRILQTIYEALQEAREDLFQFISMGQLKKADLDQFSRHIQELSSMAKVSPGDGNRVKKWKIKFDKFVLSANPLVKNHYQIRKVVRLFEIFPALVLPLELRDDAGEIHKALTEKSAPIRLMLTDLNRISGSLPVNSYARGLVVSHTESAQDVERAYDLVRRTCPRQDLVVIPLFESRESLNNAGRILQTFLDSKGRLDRIHRLWNGKFEIMLGYSDSAKQVGVISSRRLIYRTMFRIEKIIKAYQLRPVFFHGSGGSVARGGGSLREQVGWWSDSAIRSPKLTVQGEMIQRLFATPEILDSQCMHLSREALRRKSQGQKRVKNMTLKKFASLAERQYERFVGNRDQLSKVLDATPYRYLEVLRLGSRPSKRPSENPSINSLRAIPWVLCWTQTRILLPTWWGLGTAWTELSAAQREELKSLALADPFLSSFVKSVGFTLAKVELDVWELYLKELVGAAPELTSQFRREFELTLNCIGELNQGQTLLWYRPWLAESIRLRSSHIHILNVLQIQAMQQANEPLLRESLVGIACGMLTTG